MSRVISRSRSRAVSRFGSRTPGDTFDEVRVIEWFDLFALHEDQIVIASRHSNCNNELVFASIIRYFARRILPATVDCYPRVVNRLDFYPKRFCVVEFI